MALTSCYVTRQAWYQNNLFNSRRKVEVVLADPKTPVSTRRSLLLVQAILVYANHMGLNSEGAYTYYIETDQDAVSYLVQAAEYNQLKSVTWWFPVVGKVPYLGFFSREERGKKAAELSAQGYDVYESSVGAYSSLGWFEDPIFSPMLRRKEPDLAHLFFHELTHRTLWVPGSTEFNENLAEYVADVVTHQYLKSKKMDAATEAYDAQRADKALFVRWLQDLRQDLKKLYQSPPATREALVAAKAEIFKRYCAPPLKPLFKVTDYVGKAQKWNNAVVMGASLYSPNTSRFQKAAACVGGTVKDFLDALKAAVDKTDDGFTALDSLCSDKEKA
jgi:predicted aminopeptidase